MLTGNEIWVKFGTSGGELWVNYEGEKWPVTAVELECELVTIDVTGITQNVYLHDCQSFHLEYDGKVILQDDFYKLVEP